jgi:hypothetical protein
MLTILQLIRILISTDTIATEHQGSYTQTVVHTSLFLDFLCPLLQSVAVGKVNILGGHSIGHSKQKSVYVHVSYSERFPR